jgi:hypothetical protein
MGTSTKVAQIPTCDLCRLNNKNVPAYADARVPTLNIWAHVCKEDFDAYGCSLGTGKGQQFVTETDEPQDQTQRIRERVAGTDWENLTDFNDFEEIFEDRDPAEFL